MTTCLLLFREILSLTQNEVSSINGCMIIYTCFLSLKFDVVGQKGTSVLEHNVNELQIQIR